MSNSKIQEMITHLIECEKSGFIGGEKNKYSGLLNQWFKRTIELETLSLNPRIATEYILCYKQKVIFLYEKLTETEKHSLSKNKQQKILIKRGQIEYPHFSYRCAFMCCKIRVEKDTCWLHWISGDDDICNSFIFPSKDLEKVKYFIFKNKNNDNFQNILSVFVEDNGYKFY